MNMRAFEIFATILVAAMSAGGPISLMITTRTVRKSQGQGTQIDKRLESIELLLSSITDSGTNLTRRLNDHDRELEQHKDRIDNHAERILILETAYEPR